MIELIQLLFSFWPIIILAVFIPLPGNPSGGLSSIRRRLLPLLAAWSLWAVFGLILLIAGIPALGLIPEPANSLVFILIGVTSVVVILAPKFLEYIRIRRALLTAQNVDDLRRLNPEDFEELIAAYFRQYGYKVRRIGRSGDHGIDLLIYTRNNGKWIVQCKRWRGSVGEPLIRELFGAMHHEQAQRAFMMTTGTFTLAAISWAKDKPITLYDGEGLVRLLQRIQKTRH